MFKELSSKTIKYLHGTPIGMALGTSSPEQWQEFQETELTKAKKISDFVAIIMPTAFAYLCFLFFNKAAGDAEFWLTKIAYGMCS